MNFYLSKNGQKMGPYSAEQIQIFLQQGLVLACDQVFADGWSSWMPISNVPGLSSPNPSGQAVYPPGDQQIPSTGYVQPVEQDAIGRTYAQGKNPVVACILSLLIVGTGQFYNGEWGKGWAMLITCIFATTFSFGTLWLFWALFSAVDAYRIADRKKPLGAMFSPF